jgi:hypothetical protein
MRVHRTLEILTVLTTLATLAACSSYGRGPRNEPGPNYAAVDVQWNSGPLDADYHRQRGEMDTRHTQEVANPRADESSDHRLQRHTSENQDLERRYAQGKTSHADHVPPSNR